MPLITCPECGNSVSDKAAVCPRCGMPIKPSIPIGGNNLLANGVFPNEFLQPQQNSGAQSEFNIINLKCPHCAKSLGPNDLLSKNWAKCPQCGENIPIGGNDVAFDENLVIERLSRFECTKEHIHQILMQHLMDKADFDVFDDLKVISQKRKYLWVHEFGKAENRAIFPMCEYGKVIFEKLIGKPYMLREQYEEYFRTDRMVKFNSDDIRDAEIIAKEESAAENNYQFSHFSEVGTYSPTPYYYCLPIIEEIVEYHGKQYVFIGTANGPRVGYGVGDFPKSQLLGQAPKYTKASPIKYLILGIGILVCATVVILTIYNFVNDGFWAGLFVLLLYGVIGIFVEIIICIPGLVISKGLDALIRTWTNRIRRAKFRKRWKELQEHKRQAAKKNFRLDLTYEVPEFPIP